MKKSKINPQFQPFFNIRTRLWRSSGGSLGVNLPEQWCSRHGIGHLAEIEMCIFQDALLLFPLGTYEKLSDFASRLPSTVMMMTLREELKNAVKDVEQAFKESFNTRTRNEGKR